MKNITLISETCFIYACLVLMLRLQKSELTAKMDPEEKSWHSFENESYVYIVKLSKEYDVYEVVK